MTSSSQPVGEEGKKRQIDLVQEGKGVTEKGIEEKEDERRTPSASPAVVAFSPYTNVNPYPIFTMDEEDMGMSPLDDIILDQVLNAPPPMRVDMLFEEFTLDIPPQMAWQMDLPLYEFSETPSFIGDSASVVPAPGTLYMFAFMMGRRRRR